jgi:hypothetical protein
MSTFAGKGPGAWATVVGLAAILATAVVGCGYDPVIQKRIENNPPEDPAGPSPLHRAGQPCVDCHGNYEKASPELAVGGTIFHQDLGTLQLLPVPGVFVTIYDSAGATHKACTNAAGNFYITKKDLQGIDDLAFPLTVQVGHRFMRSLIGRERSCANCHKLATLPKVESDLTTDPSTGQARDSAGAILVDPDFIPEAERCGQPIDASTAASGSGAGGAGVGGSGAGGSGAGGSGVGTSGVGGAATTASGAGGSAAGGSGTAGAGGTP